jgi:hypothetical protein
MSSDSTDLLAQAEQLQRRLADVERELAALEQHRGALETQVKEQRGILIPVNCRRVSSSPLFFAAWSIAFAFCASAFLFGQISPAARYDRSVWIEWTNMNSWSSESSTKYVGLGTALASLISSVLGMRLRGEGRYGRLYVSAACVLCSLLLLGAILFLT